jgi:hypothetical protein
MESTWIEMYFRWEETSFGLFDKNIVVLELYEFLKCRPRSGCAFERGGRYVATRQRS